MTDLNEYINAGDDFAQAAGAAAMEQPQEKKEYQPSVWLIEARSFVESNGQGPLQEKSVQAYIQSRVRYLVGDAEGRQQDVLQALDQDPIFKLDISKTEAAAFAPMLQQAKLDAISAVSTARKEIAKDPSILEKWETFKPVINAACRHSTASIRTQEQIQKQAEYKQRRSEQFEHLKEVGSVIMELPYKNRALLPFLKDSLPGCVYQPKFQNWRVPLDALKKANESVREFIFDNKVHITAFNQEGKPERLMSAAAAKLVGRNAVSLDEAMQQSAEMKKKAAITKAEQLLQSTQQSAGGMKR